MNLIAAALRDQEERREARLSDPSQLRMQDEPREMKFCLRGHLKDLARADGFMDCRECKRVWARAHKRDKAGRAAYMREWRSRRAK